MYNGIAGMPGWRRVACMIKLLTGRPPSASKASTATSKAARCLDDKSLLPRPSTPAKAVSNASSDSIAELQHKHLGLRNMRHAYWALHQENMDMILQKNWCT